MITIGIYPGMALTPLPSSIGQGSNPRPSDCEPSALPLDHSFHCTNFLVHLALFALMWTKWCFKTGVSNTWPARCVWADRISLFNTQNCKFESPFLDLSKKHLFKCFLWATYIGYKMLFRIEEDAIFVIYHWWFLLIYHSLFIFAYYIQFFILQL